MALIRLARFAIALLVPFTLLAPQKSSAADREPNEVAAQKLLATTVTVRATVRMTAPQADEVVVASGVSLGKGRIVTFAPATPRRETGERDTAAIRFRATLPAGEQAEAKLRVFDHYSGLVLLKVDAAELPALEIAKELPKVGATVLTAAAAGIEGPAISAGILGGADRTLPVVDLPPLLQCDVRTTETSSGAAIVDRDGRLIGIVAANTVPGERPGWTYAIPMSHLERLLAAEKDGQLIELKRRRPAIGLTLGPGDKDGIVQVERVEDGPAARAGIKAGDVILEADDRRIRSAYQAVNRIIAKQPGDKVTLVIERAGEQRRVDVTLEAAVGAPAASAPAASPPEAKLIQIGPQLRISNPGANQITVHNSQGVEEVGIDAPTRARRAPSDEVEMLRIQVNGFEKVIEKLQGEISARQKSQAETEKLVESLRAELAAFKGESAGDKGQGTGDKGQGTGDKGQGGADTAPSKPASK